MPRLSPLPKNKPIDPNARKADKANAIHRLSTKSIRVLSGISLIVFMPRSPSSSAISECGPSNFHHLRPHPPEVGDHHVARYRHGGEHRGNDPDAQSHGETFDRPRAEGEHQGTRDQRRQVRSEEHTSELQS